MLKNLIDKLGDVVNEPPADMDKSECRLNELLANLASSQMEFVEKSEVRTELERERLEWARFQDIDLHLRVRAPLMKPWLRTRATTSRGGQPRIRSLFPQGSTPHMLDDEGFPVGVPPRRHCMVVRERSKDAQGTEDH